MIKCVVIDDEQPATELIALHLSGLQGFELSATFNNALEGFSYLQKNAVDLLLLDIQMPKVTGLELVRSLRTKPKIIFTTAYREHAVEAFELDVLDYLVKPITEERFMKAISKFTYYSNFRPEQANTVSGFDSAYLFIKIGKTAVKVYLADVLYIEGLKDFSRVHTAHKVLLASERLSYMEEKLPEKKFARVHKSFIVPLEKIDAVHTESVLIGRTSIPIGRVFKNEFLKKLRANNRLLQTPHVARW